MPRYRFEGDTPRSLPEYAIDAVWPSQVVDTGDQDLDNPDFKLIKEVKEKEAKAEPQVDPNKAEAPKVEQPKAAAGAEAKATENKE